MWYMALNVLISIHTADLSLWKTTTKTTGNYLSQISTCSMGSIPKRLQAMMMRLGRYHILDLMYKPGKTVILADTLSRAHDTDTTSPSFGPFDSINALRFMPISDRRLDEVRQATAEDDLMCQLIGVILYGWPDNKNLLPEPLTPNHPIRDTLHCL